MMQIYFTVDNPQTILDYLQAKQKYYHLHWLNEKQGDTYFGVAIVRGDFSAEEEVKRALTEAGAEVLPDLDDTDTPVTTKAQSKLQKAGVATSDHTRDIANKIFKKTGGSVYKPR